MWEVGSDFRGLSLDSQWAYEMLVSQPQINNLGLLPYTPEKWWRFAADLTAVRLHQALTQLEQAAMTVTDSETGELLVRTFIKHDRIWKQPKLVTNARKLIREVESHPIRSYLLDRHPWLIEESWSHDKIERHETTRRRPRTTTTEPLSTHEPTANGKPLTEGEHEGVTEALTEGVSPPRARVRDGLPLPQAPTPTTGSSVSETRAVAAPLGTALTQITPELRNIQ